MKRSMGGGSYRGPVGIVRQRRTIRFVQICLVVVAAALLMLAGYSLGVAKGFERGRKPASVAAPKSPSAVKTVVLVIVGGAAFGAALLLQGQGGARLPVPARLEELTGRAEASAIERAETASESPS